VHSPGRPTIRADKRRRGTEQMAQVVTSRQPLSNVERHSRRRGPEGRSAAMARPRPRSPVAGRGPQSRTLYAGLVQGSSRGPAERDICPPLPPATPHRQRERASNSVGPVGFAALHHDATPPHSPATPCCCAGQTDRIRTGAEAANRGWYKLNQHFLLAVRRSDKLYTPKLIPHTLMRA
jgi:hypothetical protein